MHPTGGAIQVDSEASRPARWHRPLFICLDGPLVRHFHSGHTVQRQTEIVPMRVGLNLAITPDGIVSAAWKASTIVTVLAACLHEARSVDFGVAL